ncbi:bifunctional UDP-N-acetylglucosamine diphosphorylase/glucosamine-1-phosphate N-acetyltransferase GlmU [Bartonella tamiae]|nr:bifunctional UDP-N-acetylglucosamine diphosphorylase/glucosamine-1-phosphate N-acetyltransferase GlmU [Bartonella tamiae]
MIKRRCLSIILAAGEGTRMKSSLPKVLHKIAGLPMVCHVVQQVQSAGTDILAIIVGRGFESVQKAIYDFAPHASFFMQEERRGTAHAVLSAKTLLENTPNNKMPDDVLIVFGDTPLIEADALGRARNALADGVDVVVMGFRTSKPEGYGRLIEKDGTLIAIVEEKEATQDQRQINFCNGGVMAMNGKYALSLIEKIDNHNAKQEFYLTDIVAIAVQQKLKVQAIEVPFENVLGVNNHTELAQADALWQKRKAQMLMHEGVRLLKPDSVYFSYDTVIDADVTIEPNVFFGPGVKIKKGTTIHSFSYLEDAIIDENVTVGPFARIRPGSHLEEKSKVGNFCEIKQSRIGKEAKVNHLTYIGDAKVGDYANIGAGTVTCNYDGFNKWETIIGKNAFIGSNSSLVAPIEIGQNAYVASGSVITKLVPDNSVAFGRSYQVNKEGRATSLREHFAAVKALRKNQTERKD